MNVCLHVNNSCSATTGLPFTVTEIYVCHSLLSHIFVTIYKCFEQLFVMIHFVQLFQTVLAL